MGCVYTPRGLKIRVAVQDAFIYLSRVWHLSHEGKGFTAFQGLRIVEDIVNFPEFVSWIVAIVTLSIGVRPAAALMAMVAVRLLLDGGEQIGEAVLGPLKSEHGRGAVRGALLDVVEFTYSRTFDDGALKRFKTRAVRAGFNRRNK